MQIVDFTNLPKRNKMYAGANGSKISVIYEGQQYMLKFPPPPTKNKDMSYSNSCFSEYLGCQIYESITSLLFHQAIQSSKFFNSIGLVLEKCFLSDGISTL